MRVLSLALALMLVPMLTFAQSSGIVDAWHLSNSGTMDPMGATMGITFDRAVAATYAAEFGGQEFTVNGTPAARITDGTWPAGLAGSQGNAWVFDGTDDYLSSTIAVPAGDFSVAVVITPALADEGGRRIIGSYPVNRAWSLYDNGGRYYFELSDDGTTDGGHYTLVSGAVGSSSAGRRSVVVVTYDYVADGSSVANLYVDSLAVVTDSSANGPAYASGPNLDISDTNYKGTIHDVRYWDGVALTAAQVAQLRNQWLGTTSSGGNALTVSSASPPAVMVAPLTIEPFLVDMPANTVTTGSPVASSGGLAASAGCSNLCQRGSFLTALTGWTETAGGTGDCAQSTTDYAHGTTSAVCSTADADDTIKLTSACLTVTGATAYYADLFAKLESGTGLMDLNIIEDDSADCGSPTTTTAVVDNAVPTSAWAHYGGTVTTQALTIRAQVQVSLPAAAAQAVDVDALRLFAGATDSLCYCYADTDATAVCTADIDSHRTKITAGSWTVRGTWSSPIDGGDATNKILYLTPTTGGGSNLVYIYHTADVLHFRVYDAAAGAHESTVAAASSANEDWDFSCAHTGEGVITACAKLHTDAAWTCDATPATGATMTTPNTTTYIGSDGGDPANAWLRDVVVFRRAL